MISILRKLLFLLYKLKHIVSYIFVFSTAYALGYSRILGDFNLLNVVGLDTWIL